MSQSLQEKDIHYQLHPYTNARLHQEQGPLIIERGEGVYVYDEQGKDYIEGYGPALLEVDLPEAAAVTADAFPRADDLVMVLIGDAAKIRETAAKYGPVTEMKLADPDFSPDVT